MSPSLLVNTSSKGPFSIDTFVLPVYIGCDGHPFPLPVQKNRFAPNPATRRVEIAGAVAAWAVSTQGLSPVAEKIDRSIWLQKSSILRNWNTDHLSHKKQPLLVV